MLDLKFLSLKRFTTSLKLLWQGRSLSGSVDNTVLNSGSGGDTIASDDIAGVKYQRVKMVFGADGSATDASSTNPLPCDVINALPAGDNNIGNIDVLTVITGTGATNLGKAEDAAHASADTGVAVWAVRDDGSSASLVSAASDYAPLIVDEKGALWTRTKFGTVDAPTGGGVEASTLRVTIANDSTGLVSVDDNAGSLTVDNAALSVTGGGTEASAMRVTIANDSTGLLSVDDNAGSLTIDGTVTVSSISTSITPGTAAGNLGKAEDAAHASADTGVAVWAVRDDAASASFVSAASDYTPLVVDEKGALWTRTRFGTTDPLTGGGVEAASLRVTIANDSTGVLSVDDNGGLLTVDGTVSANLNAGANNIGDVDVLTIAAGDNNIGNVDVLSISAGDNNIGNVDIVTAPTITTLHTHAHDAAIATSYVAIVGAEARTTSPTAVANADVVRLTADTAGRLITQPFGPRGIVRTGYWQFSTASEVALIGSAGAGVFSDLLHLSISNSSTQTNGIPIVTIRDAIGGATRYAYAVATAGGGVILNFPYPVPQTTAANSWTAHPNLAQATIYVMMMTIDRV